MRATIRYPFGRPHTVLNRMRFATEMTGASTYGFVGRYDTNGENHSGRHAAMSESRKKYSTEYLKDRWSRVGAAVRRRRRERQVYYGEHFTDSGSIHYNKRPIGHR